ncbi:MAG TPA: membrane protein insertion efficiency factor YidD [Nitrospinaceae bacterium]|nr:membrane protein insertion efficiency factor YidD [Nitrospinaceae bacterium]
MTVLGVIDLLVRRLFVYLVKGYRFFLSPIFGKHCRFHPTCSQYALDALNSKSLFSGIRMILVRISKCHPFNQGGHDPVK